MSASKKSWAVLYLTWGQNQDASIKASLASPCFPDADIFWITDVVPETPPEGVTVIPTVYDLIAGNLAKTELYKHIPEGYRAYLYLDSDTRILGPVDLGFEKAEQHGLAMAQANQADLGRYYRGSTLFREEGIQTRGQMNYNLGVMFFSLSPDIIRLLEYWYDLAKQHQHQTTSDQVLFNLAMDRLAVVPYTLTTAFNYRGYLLIRSDVRIWHKQTPPPKNLNQHPDRLRWVNLGRMRYRLTDRPDTLGFICRKANRLRHRLLDRFSRR